MDDWKLLQAYVQGSEGAFAELVQLHANTVYSTALRHMRDQHLAEDITQQTFRRLAEKAAHLPQRGVLAGWLYRTTCYVASEMRRTDQRRQSREREAVQMNPVHTDGKTESIWQEIEPLLDEGLRQLSESDRIAIILRYFQRLPVHEVGLSLGISEGAAKMRLGRALDKLRVFFERRGVIVPVALMATLLWEQTAPAIPAAFMQTLATAIARPAVATVVSSSVTAQILLMMTRSKVKAAALCGVLLLAGIVAVERMTDASNPGASTRKTDSGGSGLSQGQRSWIEKIFARKAEGAARSRSAAGSAELIRLREIIYSKEIDWGGLPPREAVELIKNLSPSQRREAFDLLKNALEAGDTSPLRARAASCLQSFHEYDAELGPRLMTLLRKESDEYVALWYPVLICPYKPIGEEFRAADEAMQALADAMRANPIAAKGVGQWFYGLVKFHPENEASALMHLAPLLQNDDPKVRFQAANVLARLPANPQVAAIPVLLSAFQLSPGPGGAVDERIIDALWSLKKLGDQARSAADEVRAFGTTPSGKLNHDRVMDTLAAIAPDLRSEIPELDAKLRARESGEVLEKRAAANQAPIEELTVSLDNREARSRTIARLADLGPAAVTALPRLRQVLASGGSDTSLDANNFLYDLALAIKKIDPATPNYYRPEDLRGAFVELSSRMDELNRANPKLDWDTLEVRSLSPRPFDGLEIASILRRLEEVNPALREVFAATLRKSNAFAPGLGQADPELARALGLKQ